MEFPLIETKKKWNKWLRTMKHTHTRLQTQKSFSISMIIIRFWFGNVEFFNKIQCIAGIVDDSSLKWAHLYPPRSFILPYLCGRSIFMAKTLRNMRANMHSNPSRFRFEFMFAIKFCANIQWRMWVRFLYASPIGNWRHQSKKKRKEKEVAHFSNEMHCIWYYHIQEDK